MNTDTDTTTLFHDATVEVVERVKRDLDWCDDCHGYTHMPWCPNYQQPEPVVDAVQIAFDSLWSRTPLAIQESTEHSIAEYFYRMGVIHGREAVLATTNEDLVEMRRLAGERLR